jgi:hypothetical protein
LSCPHSHKYCFISHPLFQPGSANAHLLVSEPSVPEETAVHIFTTMLQTPAGMMQRRMPPCIIATRQAQLSAGLLHRRYAAVAESAETNQSQPAQVDAAISV